MKQDHSTGDAMLVETFFSNFRGRPTEEILKFISALLVSTITQHYDHNEILSQFYENSKTQLKTYHEE